MRRETGAPRPTRPQACTAAIRLFLSVTTGGTQAGSTVCWPSAAIATAWQVEPLTMRNGATPSNCARNAGIDIGTDKAAGFADERTNTDLIAFFDDRLCRCTNVHRHGNDHVRRRGHCYGSHPGRALLMRHCGTLGRALQGFKHGLISPISLSALLWKAPEPVIPSPLITAIADTPFYKVKPSLPPLPAESKS